ncbi:MAG: hypothetical protein QXX29_01075 [Nitrososphaerota archaeon]
MTGVSPQITSRGRRLRLKRCYMDLINWLFSAKIRPESIKKKKEEVGIIVFIRDLESL